MKKISKKIGMDILIALAIFFIIYILITIRNVIIINKLSAISKNYTCKNNYNVESYILKGDNMTIVESYNKDSKYLTIRRFYGMDILQPRSLTLYKNNDTHIGIMESGTTKYATTDEDTSGEIKIKSIPTENMTFLQKLFLAASTTIFSEKCNNKKCYIIQANHGYKLWIDKETGLIVRELNEDTIQDTYYNFDSVTMDDIKKPDISGLKVQN